MTYAEDDNLDLGRLLSAAEAEERLDIPAGTIRSWWNRGREGLELGGLGRGGKRPLFWECDLIALSRGMPIRDVQGRRVLTMREVREGNPSA